MNERKVCQEFDFDRLWFEDNQWHATRDGKIESVSATGGLYDVAEWLDEKLTKAGAPAKPERRREWADPSKIIIEPETAHADAGDGCRPPIHRDGCDCFRPRTPQDAAKIGRAVLRAITERR